MFTTRSKTAFATLLAVGSVGTWAFSQQRDEPARAARPGAEAPMSPAVKRLLEARIQTAREIVKQDLERLRLMGGTGLPTFEDLCTWSLHLMEDQLHLATAPAERLQVIREHRSRMAFVERLAMRYAQTGQLRMADALRGKYHRLQADQLLAEAGVDPEKEPPGALPKDDDARPAPPPAPARR